MTEQPDTPENAVPQETDPSGQEPEMLDWLASEPSEPAEPAPSPPPPPEAEQAPEPSPDDPSAPPARVSRRTVWTITGVVLGLLLVCIVTVVLLARPYAMGAKAAPLPAFLAGERLLVAFPGRGGDDLYLLRVDDAKGDGLLLAEDVAEAAVTIYTVSDGQTIEDIGGGYGGFVPGKDWLFVWYAADGLSTLGQMNSRSEEHVTALDSKGDWLYGYVFPKRDTLFLIESLDGRSRCYVARPNGEAARVARADDCTVTLDGATAVLHDVYSDETMLSAVDVKSGKETILLDDVVGVESYRVAPDGSRVVYVLVEAETQQLLSVQRRSGEQAAVSDKLHEILAYGYAPGGIEALFYIAREQAGDKDVQLYLSTGERPIAQGTAIEASFTPDGKHIVYLVADEEGQTLRVDPLGEGERRVVLSQETIAGFAILDVVPPRLLVPVVEDGDSVLYAAEIDGANVVQVFTTTSGLRRVQYVPGEPALYVHGQDANGAHELHVVLLDGTEPVQVLAGWAEFDLLNRSPRGTHLAFQDRTVPALYAIAVEAGAAPVELDDAYARYEDAVFTANGQSIFYTARVSDERDAVDVVSVSADGGKQPAIAYEKAYLVDVRWDRLHPFVTLFESDR